MTYHDHRLASMQSFQSQDLRRQRLLIERFVEDLIDLLDTLDSPMEGLEPDADVEGIYTI